MMEAIKTESSDELADKMKIVFDDDELAQFFDGFEPLDPMLGDSDSD